jgi:hypothetical protein
MPKRLVSQGMLPDVFQQYIMKYLDDTDCNVLSRVSHGCLDAVIESGRDPVCAMRVSKFVHSPGC